MRLGTILLAVAASVGSAFSPSSAGLQAFLPRAFENGAYVELRASFDSEDNSRGAGAYWWNDTFFAEKLTFFSNGYFYHPRFIQYRLSVTGALKQEDYQASYTDTTGWRSGTGFEYDARLNVLPEHPYNLEVYARRIEPMYKERSDFWHDNIDTGQGLLFRLREKPWLLSARYARDSVTSSSTWSDTTTLGANVQYFKEFEGGDRLSFSAGATPKSFSTSSDMVGNSDDYIGGMLLDLGDFRSDTWLTKTTIDQDSPLGGPLNSDSSSLNQQFTAYLPWSLRADAGYRYQDNESTFGEDGDGTLRTLSNTTKDLNVDLINNLYESLESTVSYQRITRESSSGGSDSWNDALNLNYSKKIPRGLVLVTARFGRTETDNQGAGDVVDEPHLASPVPGAWRLNQVSVVRESIEVWLKSPIAPFELVSLKEGLHYTLMPIADTFEVNVLSLPPRFTVPGTFDFYVSYSLTVGDYLIQIDTKSWSASVDLLDNLLTPYYSHLNINSDLLSGLYPGTPLDSTLDTVGMVWRKSGWQARGEYQVLDWEVSPYTSWLLDGQYSGLLDPRTTLYTRASLRYRDYTEGSTEFSSQPYTERNATLSANAQRRLPSENLVLSAGLTLSSLQGLTDTLAYSFNLGVAWKIGKLDIEAGAHVSHSSASSDLGYVSSDRTQQAYFVRVRRYLF